MSGGHTSIGFNVDEDDYQEFIDRLGSILSYSTSHNIYVLMPQSQPPSWLDIHLTSGDSTIILRVDKRNLYLRGYSRDGGATFWEFSDSTLIPGSRSLAYGGSYIAGRSLVDAAGVSRINVQLGFPNLRNAIANLARTENPNSTEHNALQTCARALLLLTQMISESTRIRLITQHIVTNWHSSTPLTQELVNLQQAFGTFSSSVQRADFPFWTNSTPLPNIPNPNTANIWTVGQATGAFRILLYVPRTSSSVIRQVDVDAGNALYANTITVATDTTASYVRTLVSIQFVRINNIDGETPGQLYGTIEVKNFLGTETVYNRRSSERESKGPNNFATLTGPPTGISGDDMFFISVKLWDHDYFSHDDEIANGDIVWEPRTENITFANYDKHLEPVVNGKYGNVTVGYAVIRQALNATVSVVLINGDGESPAQVYGTIEASQVLGDKTTTFLSLFDKPSSEYVQVRRNESIPLTRSVVVAPATTGLTILANLRDYDRFSHDDSIADGRVHFDAMVGPQTKSISGKYGEVQVSITCE